MGSDSCWRAGSRHGVECRHGRTVALGPGGELASAQTAAGLLAVWSTMRLLMVRGSLSNTDPAV